MKNSKHHSMEAATGLGLITHHFTLSNLTNRKEQPQTSLYTNLNARHLRYNNPISYSAILFATLMLLSNLLFMNTNTIAQSINIYNDTITRNESAGNCIINSADSNLLVCGSVIETPEFMKDVLLIKLDARTGDTILYKFFPLPSSDEAGLSMIETSDNGFLIGGYILSSSNDTNFYIVKLNSSYNIDWTYTDGTDFNDVCHKVIETKDGQYIAVGYSGGVENVRKIMAIKIDRDGSFIWKQEYGDVTANSNEFAYSATLLQDNTIMICGNKITNDTSNIIIVHIDADGNFKNEYQFDLRTNVYAYSIQACKETGYVIAGKLQTERGDYDMMLMKILDDSTIIYTKTYGNTYDEVAYDIKETNDYGFVLAGSIYNIEAAKTYGYIVHVTDYGDSIFYQSYVDDNLTTQSFQSVCVMADNSFGVTGIATPVLSGMPVAFVGAWQSCIRNYTKGLWYMGCWHFNSNFSTPNKKACLFLNSPGGKDAATKTTDFVKYCEMMHIHTVVLGHLEDIIREDNAPPGASFFSNYPNTNNTTYPCSDNDGPSGISGSDMRLDLKNLVKRLHIAGVSVVLAQWLDQTPEIYNQCIAQSGYQADEDHQSIDNNIEILEAFKVFNNSPISQSQFDGLMLDYEYFAPKYGYCPTCPSPPAHTDYEDALTGFGLWQDLATEFINARGSYHINYVHAYLNRILFTDPLDAFDLNGGGTDITDSQDEIWYIDGKGFDKLSINFSNQDDYANNQLDNEDPTVFLNGKSVSNAETDLQRKRRTLEIFGASLSGAQTKVVPYLRTRNHDVTTPSPLALNCTTTPQVNYSHLGDLLLGKCFWDSHSWNSTTGAHYLPQVASKFLYQFYSLVGITSGSSPEEDYAQDYGDVTIPGFEFFQYAVDDDLDGWATRHNALLNSSHVIIDRIEDTYPITFTCDAMRLNHQNLNTANSKSASGIILLYPNPVYDIAQLELTKDFDGTIDYFKITDVLGRIVSNQFEIIKSDKNNHFKIKPLKNNSGVYFISEYKNNNLIKSIRFCVIN